MSPMKQLAALLSSFFLGGAAVTLTLVHFFPDPPLYVALCAGLAGFCLVVAATVSATKGVKR